MPTALITGTGRGLGLEFVRQYAEDGWRVIACARAPARSPALQAVAAEQPGVSIEALDVTDTSAVHALARRLDGQPVDLLVNNAGILGRSPLTAPLVGQHLGTLDYGLLAQLHDTNTLGPLRMVEAFREHVAASDWKKIATLSSGTGSIAAGRAASIGYTSSKAALNKAMTLVARSLAPRGIIVALICPGYVKTDMNVGGATVEVRDSVTGMRRLLAGFTAADAGTFTRYDGERIPW